MLCDSRVWALEFCVFTLHTCLYGFMSRQFSWDMQLKMPQTLSDSDWIFYPYNVCLSANGISVDFARRNKMILWNRCYAAVHGVMLTLVRYLVWRRESLLGVFGDAEKQVVGDVNAEKVHFLYTVYFSRIDIWLSACNIKLENNEFLHVVCTSWSVHILLSWCGIYTLKIGSSNLCGWIDVS